MLSCFMVKILIIQSNSSVWLCKAIILNNYCITYIQNGITSFINPSRLTSWLCLLLPLYLPPWSMCRSIIFICSLVGLVGSHEISCKVQWSVIFLQLLFLALLCHILEIQFPENSLETIYLDQGFLSPSSKCQARFSNEVITVWCLRSL